MIHFAAINDHFKIIDWLFTSSNNELDIDQKSIDDKTPLHFAAIYNSINVLG